jgi:uncharacterized membrane protein
LIPPSSGGGGGGEQGRKKSRRQDGPAGIVHQRNGRQRGRRDRRAFVWVLIAWATGYWGMLPMFIVALLAGLGMQWGQEGYSYAGGFTAAAITFVVTILARIAVVIAIVVPHMITDRMQTAKQKEEQRMPDLSEYDERVVDHLLDEQRKVQKPVRRRPPSPRRLRPPAMTKTPKSPMSRRSTLRRSRSTRPSRRSSRRCQRRSTTRW